MSILPFPAHETDEPDLVRLYFDRDEDAIRQTEERHGPYCNRIAFNILRDPQDAQECESDTYLRVWDAIPPTVPRCFRTYLGKLVRNLAISLRRKKQAQMRSESATLMLEELGEVLSSGEDDPVEEACFAELCQRISGFLQEQPAEDRVFFVQRYWYGMSIREISALHGSSEGEIRQSLFRSRQGLRLILIKEGYINDEA